MSAKHDAASETPRISVQELVTLHYADVYRFAYRLSGHQVDAEDLTQQTFLTACRKLHQLNELEKCRAWLFTIVHNLYLKTCRTNVTEFSMIEESVAAPNDLAELNLDFDEEALGIALGEMPESYRTPILLYYFEEIGYKEIAVLLEVPIGTVMSRLSRGKKFLRTRLATQAEPGLDPSDQSDNRNG